MKAFVRVCKSAKEGQNCRLRRERRAALGGVWFPLSHLSPTPFHPQTGLIRRRVRNTVAVIVFQPSVHLSAESEAFNLSLLLFGRSLRRSRETGAMISNIDPKWGGPRRRRKESLSRCLGDFDAGHSLLKERDILLA